MVTSRRTIPLSPKRLRKFESSRQAVISLAEKKLKATNQLQKAMLGFARVSGAIIPKSAVLDWSQDGKTITLTDKESVLKVGIVENGFVMERIRFLVH